MKSDGISLPTEEDVWVVGHWISVRRVCVHRCVSLRVCEEYLTRSDSNQSQCGGNQ